MSGHALDESIRDPVIINKDRTNTIIECPRCATIYSDLGKAISTDTGEMIVELDESGFSYKHTKCDVCGGKERVHIQNTPPLSPCVRCRGKGYVVRRSERLTILEKIEKVEENEGSIAGSDEEESRSIIKSLLGITEKQKKINELKNKLPDKNSRKQELKMCIYCSGSGVDDNVRTDNGGFLTECARCDGTGRMITQTSASYPKKITQVNDSCDVCNGEGTITLDSDPPFVKCTDCDGAGWKRHSESMLTPEKGGTVIRTCDTCNGSGLSGVGDIRTTS